MPPRIKPCCIIGCEDRNSRRFAFPSNKLCRKIWLDRIDNSKLFTADERQFGNLKICKKHFHKDCIEPNGRLRKFSLPSLNLPGYNDDGKIFWEISHDTGSQSSQASSLNKICPTPSSFRSSPVNNVIPPERTYAFRKRFSNASVSIDMFEQPAMVKIEDESADKLELEIEEIIMNDRYKKCKVFQCCNETTTISICKFCYSVLHENCVKRSKTIEFKYDKHPQCCQKQEKATEEKSQDNINMNSLKMRIHYLKYMISDVNGKNVILKENNRLLTEHIDRLESKNSTRDDNIRTMEFIMSEHICASKTKVSSVDRFEQPVVVKAEHEDADMSFLQIKGIIPYDRNEECKVFKCCNEKSEISVCRSCYSLFHKSCIRKLRNIENMNDEVVQCCQETQNVLEGSTEHSEMNISKIEIQYLNKLIFEVSDKNYILEENNWLLKKRIKGLLENNNGGKNYDKHKNFAGTYAQDKINNNKLCV